MTAIKTTGSYDTPDTRNRQISYVFPQILNFMTELHRKVDHRTVRAQESAQIHVYLRSQIHVDLSTFLRSDGAMIDFAVEFGHKI